MKTCFKCLCAKPLDDFYTHPSMADGHLNKCKECAKRDAKDFRHGEGRSIVLERDRERSKRPERRAAAAKVWMEWKKLHPERRAAQIRLGSAVRSGRVKPWPVCAVPECCGKPEAHHPDYSAPLDVVWLCIPHHRQAHQASKQEPF